MSCVVALAIETKLMLPIRSCLFPLLLALPAFAQESAPETTAAASGPVLVLKTSEAELAGMAAMMAFGHLDELPTPPADGHYVLSLGGDKKLSVTTGTGAVGLLDLMVDPGPLMDAYQQEIQDNVPMLRGGLTVALQQGGFTAKEAAGVWQDLLAFPRQLARLSLRVTGDPETIAETGMDVVLDLQGKASSAFATIVEKLAPSSQGAPSLGGAKGLMDFQMSLTPESMAGLFAPMREFALGFMANGDENRERAAAMYDKWMALYDGGMSMSFGEGMRGRMLIGVLDGAKLRAELASDDYVTLLESQRLPNRDAEIEVTPDALEHRGVKMLRSRMTGLEQNPMMPDGKMETHLGAVGNYMAMALGGGEADAKALIDAVSDQKVTRAPLPDGALLRVAIDVRGFMAMALAGAGMDGGAGEDMPSSMTMALTRTGTTLRLATRVQ